MTLSMRRSAVLLLGTMLLGSGTSEVACAAEEAPAMTLELNVLNRGSGQRQIVLRVEHNGRVRAAAPQGDGRLVEEHIVPDEAVNLIADVKKAVSLAGLSTKSIDDELGEHSRRSGLSARIEDADDIELRISEGERTCEVRCRGLGVLSERFPDAERLQSLSVIHDRLMNVTAIVQAGGHSAAERLVVAASRQMSAEHPGTKAWNIGELSMVRARPDGSRYVQFRRRTRTPNDADEVWLTSIIESPGEEMRVSVQPPESVVR